MSLDQIIDDWKAGKSSAEDSIMAVQEPDLFPYIYNSIPCHETPDFTGTPLSPGAVSGILAISPQQVMDIASDHLKPIVPFSSSNSCRDHLDKVSGMIIDNAGYTSHLPIIARSAAKPAISCKNRLEIAEDYISITGKTFAALSPITIDGSTGKIYSGEKQVSSPKRGQDYQDFMEQVSHYQALPVFVSADNSFQVQAGLTHGAEGMGTCRTEHMFFSPDRLPLLQDILTSAKPNSNSLARLQEFQTQDFVEIMKALKGKTAIIRMLDPPLNEFIPDSYRPETNPMLGNRGARLLLSHPEIYYMQVDAVRDAARIVEQLHGWNPYPAVMIPMVSEFREAKNLRTYAEKNGILFGMLVETPRAALTAESFTPYIDFVSIGSNDLTQMCYGISRDDSESFVPEYIKQDIFDNDPFEVLDIAGVGSLIKNAVQQIRTIKPNCITSMCGEQLRDLQSMRFYNRIGIDYVSSSPFNIPWIRVVSAKTGICDKNV